MGKKKAQSGFSLFVIWKHDIVEKAQLGKRESGFGSFIVWGDCLTCCFHHISTLASAQPEDK